MKKTFFPLAFCVLFFAFPICRSALTYGTGWQFGPYGLPQTILRAGQPIETIDQAIAASGLEPLVWSVVIVALSIASCLLANECRKLYRVMWRQQLIDHGLPPDFTPPKEWSQRR